MHLQEINEFIDWEIERLNKYYESKDHNELILASALKVVEEMGELYNEVLAHKGYQRKDKLEKLEKEDIEKEFADVMLTLMILAKRLNVDIEKSIKSKIDIVKNRVY